MFRILEFILIILLNETNAYKTQDIEIILLPAWNITGTEKIQLTLKAFGKLIQLNLRKNDQIVSPTFEEIKYNAKGATEMLQLKASHPCFYLHKDYVSSAAINFCQENGVEGLIFVDSDTLEIRPLRREFAPLSIIHDFCVGEEINLSFGEPHVIKRVQYFDDINMYWNNFERKRRRVQDTTRKLTIELAVFFDEAAYRKFMPLLDNDNERIGYMILAYVNCIQAAFHHPSLGVTIDISLVYLDIMKKQPPELPVDTTDTEMLISICDYSKTLNPPDDKNLLHWDVALYLTGIDIYDYLKRPGSNLYVKDYGDVGISINDAICNPILSCAVVEIDAASDISLGLKSCINAVHEIGHLLGLEHLILKSEKKYIMTEHKTDEMQVLWSAKSRNKLRGLWERKQCLRDHERIENLNDTYIDSIIHYNFPGREWTAKAQCEVLLRDKDANVVTLHDICEALQCETPHKNTYYFVGPALAGTPCTFGKECHSGECVPVIEPPYIFKYCEDNVDNWSEWKEDSCKSSCLEKSKGVRIKRRFCKHQNHRTANCIGPYYDVVLCDNFSPCSGERMTNVEFANQKCTEFGRIRFGATLTLGWQCPHEVDNPFIACTIFCVRVATFDYESRSEMLYLGLNPYFPDGTWCHKEGDQDYYCRQHYCLPQNYSLEEH